MEKWQKAIILHHQDGAEILTENTMAIKNAGYDKNGNWFNDLISKKEFNFEVTSVLQDTKEIIATEKYEKISEYLGY